MTAGRKNSDSMSQHWCTPLHYVTAVRGFFGGQIDLDPCSNKHSLVNASVEYRLPDRDGLREPWEGRRIYVNPPYGADRDRKTTIRDWLARCRLAYASGSEVVALVPVATNTRHWKESVWGAASSVAFLADTRLKFLVDGQPGGKGAPMACAMIYWGGRTSDFESAFGEFGAVVDIRALRTPAFVAVNAPRLFDEPVSRGQALRRA